MSQRTAATNKLSRFDQLKSVVTRKLAGRVVKPVKTVRQVVLP